MKDEIVTLETAKLAKEKGFDLSSPAYYGCDEPVSGKGNTLFIRGWVKWEDLGKEDSQKGTLTYSAPPQSLLQNWLREKHKIDVSPYSTASGYDFTIDKAYYTGNISGGTQISSGNYEGGNLAGRWETYEEALEAGLIKALKLI